jgi:hypothetical protein
MTSEDPRDLLPELPDHVASEFLLWLWYRETQGNNVYEMDDGRKACIELLDMVELKRPEEEKASVTLRAVSTGEHPELLASLCAGRVLHRASMSVEVIDADDRTFRVTLTGKRLTWSGVKLPAIVKTGDMAEQLYEQIFLYEELHTVLRSVFAQFASRRISEDRWQQEGNSLRRWLGATFARTFKFDPTTGQGMLFG